MKRPISKPIALLFLASLTVGGLGLFFINSRVDREYADGMPEVRTVAAVPEVVRSTERPASSLLSAEGTGRVESASVPREELVAHQHVPAVLREEERTVAPALRELGERFVAQPFADLEFPLFDGASVQLTHLRHAVVADGAGVFTARIAGDPMSHVVLSYFGEAESGTIQHPASAQFFEIRAGEDGASFLTQIDPNRIPPCAVCTSDPPALPL